MSIESKYAKSERSREIKNERDPEIRRSDNPSTGAMNEEAATRYWFTLSRWSLQSRADVGTRKIEQLQIRI
jgi:hypothetical protein